jgi:hypothetical protein
MKMGLLFRANDLIKSPLLLVVTLRRQLAQKYLTMRDNYSVHHWVRRVELQANKQRPYYLALVVLLT